ncbi:MULTISPECIES: DUF1788 domain-containing protein [Burkholderiales]|uniref:DUF1788 domain-containing protein n=1 Tax=Achromobacter marplatensis TaxID=470868 RepID=A0AA42WBZ3_9BURK|nr:MULTISPECIES: DUF1788 domain-containing protein [Burkholderiales]MDH2051466.1 DUF1788 domain-containing protein [Achromobacter marplatensis]OJX16154.1 MAG: hypothetical protein BGO79_00320 [Delftia sp. 67-8]
MIQKISQQPLAKRFDHLREVIASPRFLQMRGLNNDLPFYICEFKASEAFEIQRMRRQLVNTLAGLQVECLQGRGVKVVEINLYDLTIDMLKTREGSSEGSNLWDEILVAEPEVEKEALQELLQNVLDIKGHLIPEIGERLAQSDHDVLFLSGVGEVFPYIRSHNVLNNLQSTAKDKPTVMFFPGEYRHSLEQGASLELFGLLHDDKYYRAFNIFDIQA